MIMVFNMISVMIIREDEFCDRLHNRANFKGCTSLHYAALADDPDITEMLLKAGCYPYSFMPCLLNNQ